MSYDTVYRMVREGRLKAARPGKMYRIKKEELLRLLENSEAVPA
jgi:excisionase family DNA binding protein